MWIRWGVAYVLLNLSFTNKGIPNVKFWGAMLILIFGWFIYTNKTL